MLCKEGDCLVTCPHIWKILHELDLSESTHSRAAGALSDRTSVSIAWRLIGCWVL